MRFAVIAITLLFCQNAISSSDNKPGHSVHGQAFDEGPRQAAVLMEGMGKVDFAITTKSEDCRRFFNQGVGQLHGFWYYEAERSFRQAAVHDPDCAMTYWGMTMANFHNASRAKLFIKEATKRQKQADRRGQAYITALDAYFTDFKKSDKQRREALVKAMERIVARHPDDIEAKAFLIFHQWDNAQNEVPLKSRDRTEAMAKAILKRNPMHPGAHHYRIHLWDDADDENRALDSAIMCGLSATGIAHLWHMPAHIYTGLHRYREAAWHQEASARVDHAQMTISRLMPDQIHNYPHNNDWLVENLSYVGRVNDAIALAKNMIELPRVAPEYKVVGRKPEREKSSSFLMGRSRLRGVLVDWEHWEDILALEDSVYFAPSGDVADDAKILRALAIAAFQKGDISRGDAKAKALDEVLQKTKEERYAKAEAAERLARQDKKGDKEISEAMADALLPSSKQISLLEDLILETAACRVLATKPAGEKAEIKPPAYDKERSLGRTRLSQIHLAAGNDYEAEDHARRAVEEGEGQVLPLANYADVLWRLGKKKEAVDAYQKLRPLCTHTDFEQPVFQRLQALQSELEPPEKWKQDKPDMPVIGDGRDIKSLGPIHWKPFKAPGWSLPDQKGSVRSLADFKGKPLLVIFYLGGGCPHCIDQLNTFGPFAPKFADAGIQLLAISADPAAKLKETFSQIKNEEAFSFPILADETLASFKAYRAYDDFEKAPLHGTFLIDGDGYIRWQDISYQPFSQAGWLLDESRRLLQVSLSFPN